MSVRDNERYLVEAIESILGQSYQNLEFVIVDDGSRDRSLEIIRAYSDRRIKVITRGNRGLVSSLNEAIALASGEYVARQDGDDISRSDRIAAQVAFLQAAPDYGFVSSNCLLIDEDGNQVGDSGSPVDSDDLRLGLCASNVVVHGTVMLRRRVLDRIGLYDPRAIHAEDYDLWVRVSHVTAMACIGEPLYRLRLHQSSVSALHRAVQEESAERIRYEAFEWFRQHRTEYRVAAFHDDSYPADRAAYRVMKSTLYRNLAYLYLGAGEPLRAAMLLALAVRARPSWKKNYKRFGAIVFPSLRAKWKFG